MSDINFKDKMFNCNKVLLNEKEIKKKNLETVINTEKSLKKIVVDLNTFLDYSISTVLDKKKVKNDNESRITSFKSFIENFISSIHENITSFEYGFSSKFKLYIQEYSGEDPIYNLGSGNSDVLSSDEGNLAQLSPFRINYELINGIQSFLFVYPAFSIVYDPKNISLDIKIWDVNNNKNLKSTVKNKEYILNLIPEISDVYWRVYNVFDNLKIKNVIINSFNANYLIENENFEITDTGCQILTTLDDRLYNLDSMNWGNTFEVRYDGNDVNTTDADLNLVLEKHVNQPNGGVEFYFTFSGTLDTTLPITISTNIWNINTNNSKNYFNVQEEIFESNQLLEFMEYVDGKHETVQNVINNIKLRGAIN